MARPHRVEELEPRPQRPDAARGIAGRKKLADLGLQSDPLRSLPDELRRPCLVTPNLGITGFTDLPPEAANLPNVSGLPGQRVHR